MQMLTGSLGRILYAVPFGIFGLMHFMAGGEMAGMVPSWLPGGVFWVYLTGLALILVCVSFIIQKQAKLAALLLALMLALFILFIHLPGVFEPATWKMSMPNLLRDLALAGAALTYAGLFGKND